MAAALQCPDCGHQEMLENLGGVTTFRCGGCGRVLKVPAQFRTDPAARGTTPGSRPPGPGDPTQALPKVPPVSTPPVAAAPPVAGPPVGPTAAAGPPVAGPPTGRSPIAVAGDTGDAGDAGGAGGAAVRPPMSFPPGSLRPPLILRLVLWLIALPIGSLLVFGIANRVNLLTRLQLENTFVLTGWGRFVPIARLLPFCALATALIVQLGQFGLERLRARNLRGRPPGRGGARPGATRPLRPGGDGQPATNGARSRDRLTS